MSKTHLERAIRIAGGQSQLARRIGGKVRQGHVWKWLNRCDKVPVEAAIKIEEAVAGEVTRHDLRPDVFGPSPDESTPNQAATA